MDGESDLDFNVEDNNGFYYTSDKQIRKMDDTFIMSKISEKYPDFISDSGENLLKQTFMVIAKDTKFLKQISSEYDIPISELFSIIYRTYSFLFNPCYISKLQKIVSKRLYVKSSKTTKSKKYKRT